MDPGLLVGLVGCSGAGEALAIPNRVLRSLGGSDFWVKLDGPVQPTADRLAPTKPTNTRDLMPRMRNPFPEATADSPRRIAARRAQRPSSGAIGEISQCRQ